MIFAQGGVSVFALEQSRCAELRVSRWGGREVPGGKSGTHQQVPVLAHRVSAAFGGTKVLLMGLYRSALFSAYVDGGDQA